MESTFNITTPSNYDFGNTVRDDALQFQIDNDVAQKITAERITEGEFAGQVLITLYSKNDNELYSAHFKTDDGRVLNGISLDHASKQLVLTFTEGDPLTCDLAELYNKIDTQDANLNTKIDQEVIDREAAISNEASLRVEADIQLQSNIDLETENRIADVNAEELRAIARENQIENNASRDIAAEMNRALSAEEQLQRNISNESQTRYSEDVKLQSNINNESTRAQSREQSITNSLNSEINRSTSRDDYLQQNINNEATSRSNADLAINVSISNVNTRIDNLDLAEVGSDGSYIKYVSQNNGQVSALKQDFDKNINATNSDNNAPTTSAVKIYVDDEISAERTRAQQEESNLSQAISDLSNSSGQALALEIQRATAAEASLNQNISNEINRATANESAINSSLNIRIDNLNAAQNIDASETLLSIKQVKGQLSTSKQSIKISESQVTNLTSDLSEIRSNISAEISRAKEKENIIIGDLDNESTQRKSADTALDSAIRKILNSKGHAADGDYAGIATLDSDTKIPISQIPDAVLGQMLFGGSVEKVNSDILAYPTLNLKTKLGISDDTIKLVNSANDDKTKDPKWFGFKSLEGAYFVVRSEFDVIVEGITTHFDIGDWLIGAGTYWDKIDNTDAVTGVKGDAESEYRRGNVNITKNNIGLGNVDNTTDLNKPISNAARSEFNNVWSNISSDKSNISTLSTNLNKEISYRISNDSYIRNDLSRLKSDIDSVNQSVQWTNASLILEISRAEESEYAINTSISSLSSNLAQEINRATNSESSLRTLINTENTSRTAADLAINTSISNLNSTLSSKISTVNTSLTSEISRAKAAEEGITSNLSSHISNNSNPHKVTKSQVGLGNVDNTSDLNKPISNATQTALDAINSSKQANLTAGNFINISSDNVITTTYTAGQGINISSTGVISNTRVSAEWGNIQGNIANQSDLQEEFATKQDKLPTPVKNKYLHSNASTGDLEWTGSQNILNPGYGIIIDSNANISVNTSEIATQSNISQFITKNVDNLANYTNTSTLNTLLDGKQDSLGNASEANLVLTASNTSGGVEWKKAIKVAAQEDGNYIKLADYEAVTDPEVVSHKVTSWQTTPDDIHYPSEKLVKNSLDAHISNTSNPHDVSKSQVGLGNVDNTSDNNKPVSTAQATAIATAKSEAKAYTDEKIAAEVIARDTAIAAYHDSSKQNILIAGDNITIATDGKTISATDTTYSDATTSVSGLMSAVDKTKLDGIYENATATSVSETGEATTEVQYITINGTEYKLAGGSSSAINYNSLENIPIINQDLAANFTPTLGKYYRHTGTTTQAGTPIAIGDSLNTLYFNADKSAEDMKAMLASLTYESGIAVISGDDMPIITAISLEVLGPLYTNEYALVIRQGAESPYHAAIVYSTKAACNDGIICTQGWQNLSSNNSISLNNTCTISRINSSWSGIIVSGSEFTSSGYTVDTIYKCISTNPITYSSLATNLAVADKMNKTNPVATGFFSLNGRTDFYVGEYSVTTGENCLAAGKASHSEGEQTIANSIASHAEGYNTTASGNYAHAEGQGQLTTINVTEINEAGNRLTLNTAISESELKAGMVLRHTEDQIYRYYIISQIDDVYVYLKTNVVDKNINNWYLVLGTASNDGAHSEGLNTTASERGAHAEGGSTIASQIYAHAEGAATVASGTYSHAEGFLTTASCDAAHAEGAATVASGTYSHAEGFYTNASGDFQHVFGKYNATDTNKVEIVGKGSEETPSNARTLDWSGNEWLAGKLEATNGIDYKNSSGTSFTNGLKFVKCTQAEYDALVSAGTVDSNTFYIIVG